MSTGDDEGLVARPVDDSLLGERDKVAAALFGRQASPKTIGRYAIEDVLGRGAMGVVYEAWDEELQRTVAVKLISRDVEMGDAEARFKREALALAKLAHPNVVTIHEVGTHEGRMFIAMELVRGQTLDAWLRAEERSWQTILDVFVQAGRGLVAAHAAGLVHRDFKPANCIVGESGRVRVLDFGLARGVADLLDEEVAATQPTVSTLDISVTRTGATVGTPAYMAPEQLRGEEASAASDQFAFCVALYEALVGVRPFAGRSVIELHQNVGDGRLQKGERAGPRDLVRPILRGLASDPSRRWSNIGELVDALEVVPSHRAQRRRAWTMAGLGLVAVGIAGVAWLPADPCADLPTTAVWGDARRVSASTRISSQAFRATFDERLRLWEGEWNATQAAVCTAYENGETTEGSFTRQRSCLSRRDARLERLLRAANDAPSADEAYLTVLRRVPALRDCADADFVWTVEPPAAGISADVARANDEVDFSIAATVAGNPTGSATRLDRAMELAHQSGYEPLIARVLLEKGWTLRHDDPIDAIAKLQQAFGVAEQGGADATAADIASALVLLAAFTGRSEMGNSWNDVAIAKLERIEARPMRRAIHARAAAELALVRREPEAALALVDTMLVYAREAAGEGRLIEGDALGLRARVIELVGTEAEALEAHAVSLYASRELYGDEHPSYATGLWNRGLFLSSIGDFESAMTDFGAAAGLLHGSGERGLLLSLHVAWARAASMSGGVPANLLGRVVELQDALPETHPDRQDAMSMVATELLADGQAERALKLFERVVAVKRELDEFDAVDLALAESNVGECLLELERWSEAERRFTRSLLVLERELGPDDALLAYALTGLGRALTGLDSTVDALPLLERSWELLEDEAADRRLLAQTATALARLSPPKRAEALLSRAEEYFGQLKRQTNR